MLKAAVSVVPVCGGSSGNMSNGQGHRQGCVSYKCCIMMMMTVMLIIKLAAKLEGELQCLSHALFTATIHHALSVARGTTAWPAALSITNHCAIPPVLAAVEMLLWQ